MRNLMGLLLGLAAVVASAAEQFGAPLTLKTPVTLEAAVQSLGDRGTADVLVESTVAKVCEQRGCWLALKSASSQLHVTFKDEAFFVPASLIGKTVLVQGKLTKAGASYELVASEAKATADEAAINLAKTLGDDHPDTQWARRAAQL